MQLRLPRPAAAAATAILLLGAGVARAESGIGTTTTFFHESGGALDMTVLTPSAHATVDMGEAATVSARWEADVVSGASVAVVDAPGGTVDAITSATTLSDVRHVFGGSLTFNDDNTSLTGTYDYGFEEDYRSHGMSISARAEMFERNTAFEVSYARGWDRVCTLLQPRAQEAVDRSRLPNADGCFQAEMERDTVDVSLQTFQGGWTQAWTPVLTTQLTLTAQILNGFQGNPYRAVWLGRTAAQEHHPENRARYAAGLGVRFWVKPLRGAAQLFGRLYRDSWGVESFTGEIAYDQAILAGLRLKARGRYYTQIGASFYSDDYQRFPQGQYFTGDRELSPMSSVTVGGQLTWDVPGNEEGDVLGFLGGLEIVGKADLIFHDFSEFHYGRAEVPTDTALMATFGIEAIF